jgi:hypothetical protein
MPEEPPMTTTCCKDMMLLLELIDPQAFEPSAAPASCAAWKRQTGPVLSWYQY